ncbi:hypothetical protein [Microbispora bryophytorum]|nr:hypothetical protein [Microbispora bryophytorum]
MATLFTLLWLKDIVPAVPAGLTRTRGPKVLRRDGFGLRPSHTPE